MTVDELKEFEDKLKENGYKKYTSCLSGDEDWGWFKSFFEDEKDEDGEKIRKSMIEFRVWDWGKYIDRDPSLKQTPLDVDILILDGDSSYRIDLNIISPKFDIETTEKIAEDLHNMLSKYIVKREE